MAWVVGEGADHLDHQQTMAPLHHLQTPHDPQTTPPSSFSRQLCATPPQQDLLNQRKSLVMANYVQEAKDKFSYVYSCEVDIPFRIKMYVVLLPYCTGITRYSIAEAHSRDLEKRRVWRHCLTTPNSSSQGYIRVTTLTCMWCARSLPMVRH